MATKKEEEEDLAEFLEKVNDVEAKIKGLADGSLKPDEIKIPGEKTEEEIEEEERQKQERIARLKHEAEERQKQQKEEERYKWWRGARLVFAKDSGDAAVEAPPVEKKRGDVLDYSKWDEWAKNPDDPLEQEKREAELDRLRDAEFEKLNPEFCSQVKEDMEKRTESIEKRAKDSDKARTTGNNAFRKKKFAEALKHYMTALSLTPHVVPILTNIAQAHLRLEQYEDVLEFASRALFVDNSCVKALSRRAAAYRDLGKWPLAIKALKDAVSIAPENLDLQKELSTTTRKYRELLTEDLLVGEFREAREAFDKMSSDSPVEAPQWDHEAMLQRAALMGISSTLQSLLGSTLSVEKQELALRSLQRVMEADLKMKVFLRVSGGLQLLFNRILGAPMVPLNPKFAVKELESQTLPDAGLPDPTPVASFKTLAVACASDEQNCLLFSRSKVWPIVRSKIAADGTAVDVLLPCLKLCSYLSSGKQQVRSLAGKKAFLGGLSKALSRTNSLVVEEVCAILQSFSVAVPSVVSGLHSVTPNIAVQLIEGLKLPISGTGFTVSTRESLVGTLSVVLGNPILRKVLVSVESVALLLNLAAQRASGVDTLSSRAFALGCLMNGAVADGTSTVAGDVRDAIVEAVCSVCEERGVDASQDGVRVLIGLLQRPDVHSILIERACGVLSRISLHPEAQKLLTENEAMWNVIADTLASIFDDAEALQESKGDKADFAAVDHIVRVVASLTSCPTRSACFALWLQSVAASRRLMRVLTLCSSSPVKRERIIGNCCKCLMAVVEQDAACSKLISDYKAIDILVGLLKASLTTAARKNVAILLARMAKDTQGLERLRELDGTQILMQLGKELK